MTSATAAAASPYDILGVAPSASADDVRHAYQRLARQHHPDRDAAGGGDDEAFVRVQAAYDALREPEARRRLDAEARAAQLAAAAAAARVLEVESDELQRLEAEEGEEG